MRQMILLIIYSALLAFIMPGCTANRPTTQPISTEQRLQQASIVYQTAMQNLIALRKAGVIDDNEYRAIEPCRAATRSALDSAYLQLATGNLDATQVALDAFDAALASWLVEVGKAK